MLPLDPTKTTAVIGPLGNDKHDMLGPWWGRGDDNDAVSLFDAMKAQNPNTTYTPGCTLSNNDLYDPANECATDAGFPAAVAAANAADQVVLALGETREMSGEAESRSMLDLPGQQEELIEAIKATGKPFAVVLFNGRPLVLDEVQANSPAILEAWFGGVEAGNGVADALYGKVNPGGKLPVSFPRNEGQVPIYYNHQPTGRPCDPNSKYNSRHRDILSCSPLYEFGYGLSYTTFKVSNLRLSSTTMNARRGRVTASVDVTNTGTRAGDEVAQLYINDPVASISQPVRRLRGFERVTLQPGQTKTVSWTLTRDDVGFYDNAGRFVRRERPHRRLRRQHVEYDGQQGVLQGHGRHQHCGHEGGPQALTQSRQTEVPERLLRLPVGLVAEQPAVFQRPDVSGAGREARAASPPASVHRHDDDHAPVFGLDDSLHIDDPVLPGGLHVVQVLANAIVPEIGAPADAEHRVELDLRVAGGDGGLAITARDRFGKPACRLFAVSAHGRSILRAVVTAITRVRTAESDAPPCQTRRRPRRRGHSLHGGAGRSRP